VRSEVLPVNDRVGRRVLAWCVDFGLMIPVAVALGYLTYVRVVHRLWGAAGAVFDLGAVLDTGIVVWRDTSSVVVQGFVGLVIVQFLYQFLALSWTGSTPGKLLADLRVVPVGAEYVAARRSPRPGPWRSAERAAVTALADTGLFSLACVVLLSGEVSLSVLCWVAAVVAFWINALAAVRANGRSMADRVAGTAVVRGGGYAAVLRRWVR
jgi:uncharacterized RDD family membrane protein YckC